MVNLPEDVALNPTRGLMAPLRYYRITALEIGTTATLTPRRQAAVALC